VLIIAWSRRRGITLKINGVSVRRRGGEGWPVKKNRNKRRKKRLPVREKVEESRERKSARVAFC